MIGRMRERATIQRNDAGRTNGVRDADNWQDVETVYCELQPLTSAQKRVAEQNREIVTHNVRIRYRDDLGTADTALFPRYRLSIGSRTFDINTVINDGFRDKYLRLRVEEKV